MDLSSVSLTSLHEVYNTFIGSGVYVIPKVYKKYTYRLRVCYLPVLFVQL